MGLESIIALLGIVASVATFILGTRRGERLERQRQEHESALEKQRRSREVASKAADEYVAMARRNYDAGPHALASLSLDLLGSDSLIREAIHEMHVRSGKDPWGGADQYVADLDLVEFFRFVREHRVDFYQTTVEKVATSVREARRSET